MHKIPKKKMLTGVGMDGKYDVYVTPRGQTWLYSGSSKEDWKNPKYWKKTSSVVVYVDKKGKKRWRHGSPKGAIVEKVK